MPRDQKLYRVYCATNKINGLRYVGLTRSRLIQRRCQHHYKAFNMGSTLAFHRALREFGKEAFDWEFVVEAGFDEEAARAVEHEWILKFNSRIATGGGYNAISWGPDSEHITPAGREKMASAKRRNGRQAPRKTDRRWFPSEEWKRAHAARTKARAARGEGCIIPLDHAELLLAWRRNGAKLKQLAALYDVTNSTMCVYLRRHSAHG